METITKNDLKTRYEQLKSENPKLRIRNAAEELGVSEMELLALEIGNTVTLLKAMPQSILKEIYKIGEVMALTRNEHVVHERKGVYNNVSFMGDAEQMGLAVNPDIDLRLFMNEWKYVFAESRTTARGDLHSFQFFDAYGVAVHKIYTTKDSDLAVYKELVEKFTHENQQAELTIETIPRPENEYLRDEEVDVAGFRKAWENMEDTHHFFGMLKKYKVSRTQALRLAPGSYTIPMQKNSVVAMLQQAAKEEVPIMVFAGSKGCIQIHTGTVNKLFEMGRWYNVMDPKFNLHLNLDGIAECWVVKKNTTDGVVTSLELFDEHGELIVYFFGARKPGKSELESWRTVVADLINSHKLEA